MVNNLEAVSGNVAYIVGKIISFTKAEHGSAVCVRIQGGSK